MYTQGADGDPTVLFSYEKTQQWSRVLLGNVNLSRIGLKGQ